MNDIYVFGLSHNTAPLSTIAKLSTAPEKHQTAVASLKQRIAIEELVWLSTCNRFEIYFTKKTTVAEHEKKDHNSAIAASLKQWLAGHIGNTPDSSTSCYLHTNTQAITHLMRLGCGLDSMILGESQILGQVKSAFQQAQKQQQTGTYLTKLFTHALMVGKRVRSETRLGQQPNSYAALALQLARRFYKDLQHKKVLMIGSGEMIELMVKYFLKKNIHHITVAARTLDKAQRLVQQPPAMAVPLSQIKAILPYHDLVISCTASSKPILDYAAIEQSMQQRKNKLVCMIDLALPPDIAAAVKTIEGVYYYDLQHFSSLLAEKKASQIKDTQAAEAIVRTQARAYSTWIKTRKFVGLIQAIKAQADAIQNQALDEISGKAKNKNWQPDFALQKLAIELTKKLTLPVVERINQAAENECNYEILRAAEQLYGIDIAEWNAANQSLGDHAANPQTCVQQENESPGEPQQSAEPAPAGGEQQSVAGTKHEP